MKITSEKQITLLTNDDISLIEFQSLIDYYITTNSQAALAVLLVRISNDAKAGKTITLDWIAEEIAPPKYYVTEGKYTDVYYLLPDDGIANLRFEDGILQWMATSPKAQFEAEEKPYVLEWTPHEN